jgi:anti-sigma-K factor RskA
MSVDHDEHVTDMLPAYVLGALTEDELSQLAQHLAGCPTCQAECSLLQQVADDLPLALVQTTPPPRVKESLMSAIHSPRSLGDRSTRPTLWQKLADFFRMPLPAAGLALIVLLVVGNIFLIFRLNRVNQQSMIPMQVVALANTQNAPGAMGTLILDEKGDYGTLVVDKLAELGSASQYQVWLIKDGQRSSGGLFSVNPDGYASLEIIAPQPLNQYDSIGITIEPSGGSPAPTGSKVLGGAIPH